MRIESNGGIGVGGGSTSLNYRTSRLASQDNMVGGGSSLHGTGDSSFKPNASGGNMN